MRHSLHLLAICAAFVLGAVAAASCTDKDKPETSKTVTAEGGRIAVGEVTIDIPEGALKESVSITAETIRKAGDLGNSTLPLGFLGAVKFGPDGTRFLKQVKVTMPLGKLPKSQKLAVYYWNEAQKQWVVSGEATAKGTSVEFPVSHFSTFAVGDNYNLLSDRSDALVDEVHGGKSCAEIFSEFRSSIESQIDQLFQWDEIGGRYYKVASVHTKYMYYFKTNTSFAEGQGILKIGESVEGWSGMNDNSSMLLSSQEDVSTLQKVDTSSFETEKKNRSEVYSQLIERELHLIPSAMTGSIDGKLEHKGDQATVRFHLSAKATSGKETLKEYHSYNDFVSGESDSTPDGGYDKTIEVKVGASSDGDNPPMYGQTLKIVSSDASAIKISAEEAVTDEEGNVQITVTALKDSPVGDVTAYYDFTSVSTTHPESDHSQATVSIGGTYWYVTGIISDHRAAPSYSGISSSADYSFELKFNIDDVVTISPIWGGTAKGVYADMVFNTSDAHIDKTGYYEVWDGCWCDYTISNVITRSYDAVRSFINLNTLEQYGNISIHTFDPTDQEPVNLSMVDYTIHTVEHWGDQILEDSTEPEEWGMPAQMCIPLKVGSYSPILMTGQNSVEAATDGSNAYVGELTGLLLGSLEECILTGQIVVSQQAPEE